MSLKLEKELRVVNSWEMRHTGAIATEAEFDASLPLSHALYHAMDSIRLSGL